MGKNVLVLNQDYQAIAICSVERAFVLVYLRKAELVDRLEERNMRTINQQFPFPSIIRLYRYVHVPFRRVALSRTNILKRDGNRCVYCGSRNDLTLDHVVPRSIGGKDSWENLVSACQTCNTKKGNRTPDMCGMEFNQPPFRPSYIMYLTNFAGSVQQSWLPYLMMG